MATIFDILIGATTDGEVWSSALPNIRGEHSGERHVATRDHNRLDTFTRRHDQPGHGCFFCVSSVARDEEGKYRRRKVNARQSPFAFCDIDFKDIDLEPDEILAILLGLSLPPTRVHSTGGGFHVFWVLDVPAGPDQAERFEQLLKRLAEILGGDPSVTHRVALLRTPGTSNTKRSVPQVVKVVRETADRYSLDQLERWLDGVADPVIVARGVEREANPFTRLAANQTFKAPIDVMQRLNEMTFKGPRDVSIHTTQTKVVGALVARGVATDEIVELVVKATQDVPGTESFNWNTERKRLYEMCADWTKDEPEDPSIATVAPVSLADALKKRGKGDNLPVVQVRAGELPDVAKRAEEILVEAEVPIYQRGGMLVRPVVETTDASHNRKTKVARLVTIIPVYLRNKLGQVAQWQRYDKRGKKFLPIDVPTEIAPIILASEGEWMFPSIAGVITTPTMRPDGTILAEAGYDEATRLLLVEPPPMPPIPDAPTKADAARALALLEGLLSEFPLVDDVAKSVALSALMTPVVRGAFPVCPMHIMRAPAPSSGKSYLNDIAAAIAIGQLMPVMAVGRSEEETEKRLGAALLTGQPLISIDNVNGELGGDFLCQAIERPIVEVRILGKSERVRIEARGTTMYGTGNNIVIVGDVCRRVITATLDPRMERPELREFVGDPVATVMADRGKYIAAALTVCRAYVVAGRPHKAKRLASFEGWSDAVRSALIWLGKADPVDSMEIARADDPERAELRDVLSAWADTVGVGQRYRITLSDLIAIANERLPQGNFEWPELNAALNNACRGRSDQNMSRSLGLWARGKKDRIVDGLSLSRNRSEGHNVQTYWWIDGPEREGAWNGNTLGGDAGTTITYRSRTV